MSRCFPYPPPGYYRNGPTHDALIESIKLQKDTDKTKADRKKEKKAKKERKEKINNEVKTYKNTIDDFFKGTKAVTELNEKSDLTQEHRQPFSPHQPSYSSDSTQNSNKRKRDDYSMLLPDNSTGSFKIRFVKKPKASDSNNLVNDVRLNICPPIPLASNSNRYLVSSVGNSCGPSTSGRENRTQTDIGVSSGLCFVRNQQQVVPSIRLEPEGPSSYVSRNIDQRLVIPNLVSSKTTSTVVAGKRPINEVSVGPSKQTEDPKKVGLTRTEKKMNKKHAKYEKLLGSWLPLVLQTTFPEVGDDEDWLSTGKALKSSTCKGDVETCRESVASWQPCARFLPEVEIHALPYTVPF
ncbi:uncharacterized protein LOC143572125 [Bidens hawaiensis]|uniref:uncharacterized protein LOC143572125 n=1 Tax=Bidens hawaiensis TaxID=980011 RepID=UPI00404B3C33